MASWPANGCLVTDTPLRDKTLARPFCCASVFMSLFFWNERESSREAGNFVEEVVVRRSNNPFLMCVQNVPFVFCHFNSIHPLISSATFGQPANPACPHSVRIFCRSSPIHPTSERRQKNPLADPRSIFPTQSTSSWPDTSAASSTNNRWQVCGV